MSFDIERGVRFNRLPPSLAGSKKDKETVGKLGLWINGSANFRKDVLSVVLQESGVRSQESGVRSQESGVRRGKKGQKRKAKDR